MKEADSSLESDRQDRRTTAIALGMSCLVVAVLAQIYSADYIFTWMPRIEDVLKSVKVHIPFPLEIIMQWGWLLWLSVTLCLVLTGVETWRKPGRPRTFVLQAATWVSALLLVILIRFASWNPFVSMLQGIGTQP